MINKTTDQKNNVTGKFKDLRQKLLGVATRHGIGFTGLRLATLARDLSVDLNRLDHTNLHAYVRPGSTSAPLENNENANIPLIRFLKTAIPEISQKSDQDVLSKPYQELYRDTDFLTKIEDRLNQENAESKSSTTSLLSPAKQKSSVNPIGEFPGYLDQIIRKIKTATISIDAMIDCVDVGSLADPDLHADMIHAICKVSRNKHIAVNMLITEEPAPISRANPFYGKSLSELRKDPVFEETLARYLTFHHDFRGQPLTNDTDFIELLQKHQESVRCNLNGAGAKIYGLDGAPIQKCEVVRTLFKEHSRGEELMPHKSDLFFFVFDGSNAIFLLSNPAPNGWKMAFETEDQDLVNVFNRIFAQHPPRY